MARNAERIYDEYLVACARAGDRDALEALGRRFERRLLLHALRLTGERDLARDVAQEAWTDIIRRLPALDEAAAFPVWAFRIVTRRAADAIRGRRRMRAGLAAFAAEPRETTDKANDLDASAPSLAAALAALPPEQRAAIALFYREDMSVAEIAAALDVPAGTVKTRLKAARDRLRLALGVSKETDHEQT